MGSLFSSLTGNYGNDAVAAGKAVGSKTKMVEDYQAAVKPQVKTPASKIPPAKIDLVNKTPASQKYGSRPGEKRLPGFKKGGKVKATRIYKLHKGERVLNPKQTKTFEKKGGLRALGGE